MLWTQIMLPAVVYLGSAGVTAQLVEEPGLLLRHAQKAQSLRSCDRACKRAIRRAERMQRRAERKRLRAERRAERKRLRDVRRRERAAKKLATKLAVKPLTIAARHKSVVSPGKLRRVLRRNWAQIRICNRMAMHRGSHLDQVSMAVTLASGGAVETVAVTSVDGELNRCLERMARAWRFGGDAHAGRLEFPVYLAR